MQLAVTSDTLSRDELTALVDDVISERLAAVPGVADVQIYGTQQQGVRDRRRPDQAGQPRADRRRRAQCALDHRLRHARRLAQRPQPEHQHRALSPRSPRRSSSRTSSSRARRGWATSRPWCSMRRPRQRGLRIRRQVGHRPRHRAAGPVQHRADLRGGSQARSRTCSRTLPPGVDIKISSDDSVFISGALHEVETLAADCRGRRHRHHLPVPAGLARDADPGDLHAGRADRHRSPASISRAFRSTS